MVYEHFKFEKAEGVARIAFNRVDKHNAANLATFDEFIDLMRAVDRDDEVQVAIVTGEGPKAFCAGVDMDAFDITGLADACDWIAHCQAVFESVENVRKPVIAAVNGLALGFGMELAMVCDITIAAETAVFGLPEIKHGMLPAVLVTRGLDIVGKKTVAYLAMTGDNFSAAVAQSLGLVNKVVAVEQLMPEALAIAQRIRRNGPLGLRTIKRLLTKDGPRHSRDVVDFLAPLMLSEDLKEARAAFFDKRRPVFTGR